MDTDKLKLTVSDIRGYKAMGAYLTEEQLIAELETWEGNTPLTIIHNREYTGYTGYLLDVICDSLGYHIRGQHKQLEYNSGYVPVNLDGKGWFIHTKERKMSYSSTFKKSTQPLLQLKDVNHKHILEFLAYYLFEATEYNLHTHVIDEYTYRTQGRYFRVGKLLRVASSTHLYEHYNVTREEVAQRIAEIYKERVEVFYGEEEALRGVERVRKHVK